MTDKQRAKAERIEYATEMARADGVDGEVLKRIRAMQAAKEIAEADGRTAVRCVTLDPEGGISVDFFDPAEGMSFDEAARALLENAQTSMTWPAPDGEVH